MKCSEEVSLNAIALHSTIKLIEQVLAMGINLKEVSEQIEDILPPCSALGKDVH